MISVSVFDDPQSLAHGAATHVVEQLATGERRSLGLAGGSTPAATYVQLRRLGLDTSRVDLWIGDERWVAPESPENNGRMVRERLLGEADGPFLPVPYGQDREPDDAAAEYERSLAAVFSHTGGRPDIVLLGLGEDGHTASLFPATAALDETSRRYVANWVAKLDTWRLTATIPLLAAARQLVFIVSGPGKSEAVRWLADPRADDPLVPARRVALAADDVRIFLDRAAAGGLGATRAAKGLDFV